MLNLLSQINEEKFRSLPKPTASSAIKGAIQLGIGYTVGNLTSKPERDVLMQDFYVVESVFLPSEGSNLTPAHHYPDFRFKTYAPLAFRYFRELFGIKPDDYLVRPYHFPFYRMHGAILNSSGDKWLSLRNLRNIYLLISTFSSYINVLPMSMMLSKQDDVKDDIYKCSRIHMLFELTDLLGLFLPQVLESFKIMDYSLLLGIHILDHSQKDKEEEPLQNIPDAKRPGMQKVLYSTAMESIQGPGKSADGIIAENPDTMGGIPAKSHKGEKLLLFMGIIDILQSYRLMKKLEHSWKALVYDGDTVSVHRPSFYADRFLKFMNSRVFKKIQALKASPSKKRCNSIAALKATSQEIVSSVAQEWKDEKRDLLTEGQSFSSLDEEALGSRHRPDLVPSTPSLFEAASLATTISSSSLYVSEHCPHDRTTLYSNSKGLPSSSTFTLEEGTIYLTAEPNTLEIQDDNASVLDVYLVSDFLLFFTHPLSFTQD
uniref:Phosphatidylinositol-4-phosphate 5-kinase, type 1 beta n=1 Tax=Cricetulus griseus TaxID=10029 RepID=A0A8C2MD99_CRIGR